MRFYATILMLFMYLFATAGVSIKVHYCGKKISGVTVYSVKDNCCCKKASTKAKCCSDKEVQVKVNDAHNAASQDYTAAPKIAISDFVYTAIPIIAICCQNETIHHFANAPPTQFKEPVYLLNSVFRI